MFAIAKAATPLEGVDLEDLCTGALESFETQPTRPGGHADTSSFDPNPAGGLRHWRVDGFGAQDPQALPLPLGKGAGPRREGVHPAPELLGRSREIESKVLGSDLGSLAGPRPVLVGPLDPSLGDELECFGHTLRGEQREAFAEASGVVPASDRGATAERNRAGVHLFLHTHDRHARLLVTRE